MEREILLKIERDEKCLRRQVDISVLKEQKNEK
jgi:hypothetical protein